MAGSNRRWNHGLFPIDEALLERLIDSHASAQDDDALEQADFDDDSVDDALVWQLEEEREDAEACDDAPIDPACAAADEAQALNMRVLNDYLRRRLIDDPDPIERTLH